jgi:hypothetical protein
MTRMAGRSLHIAGPGQPSGQRHSTAANEDGRTPAGWVEGGDPWPPRVSASWRSAIYTLYPYDNIYLPAGPRSGRAGPRLEMYCWKSRSTDSSN